MKRDIKNVSYMSFLLKFLDNDLISCMEKKVKLINC